MDVSYTEGMMKGPEGTILRFFYDSAKNEFASKHAGRAIFDTVLYVDVITPGQSHSTPSFEIERVWAEQSKEAMGIEEVSKRYPRYENFFEQIERFKRNESVDMGGTPLKQWPRIDRGLAATLAAINIHTVEHLAQVSDANLQNIGMGARGLREQAQAFLALATDTAPLSQLTGEVTDLRQEVARLQAEVIASNNEAQSLKRQLNMPPPPERKLQDITLTS